MTAPTNGAAGIVPSVLRFYERFAPKADAKGIETFLLTAAAIGSLFKENASISAILGGGGDAARIGTAEMEVVKTGGGNWAEHQWVRHQLEVARVQQDLNDTVKHNFALFEKYAEEIERFE